VVGALTWQSLKLIVDQTLRRRRKTWYPVAFSSSTNRDGHAAIEAQKSSETRIAAELGARPVWWSEAASVVEVGFDVVSSSRVVEEFVASRHVFKVTGFNVDAKRCLWFMTWVLFP
jgi:hypothetical protein